MANAILNLHMPNFAAVPYHDSSLSDNFQWLPQRMHSESDSFPESPVHVVFVLFGQLISANSPWTTSNMLDSEFV
jgi:hypothetical protein